jgi:hypothetical protein
LSGFGPSGIALVVGLVVHLRSSLAEVDDLAATFGIVAVQIVGGKLAADFECFEHASSDLVGGLVRGLVSCVVDEAQESLFDPILLGEFSGVFAIDFLADSFSHELAHRQIVGVGTLLDSLAFGRGYIPGDAFLIRYAKEVLQG